MDIPTPKKNTSGMARPLLGHTKGRWGPAASGSFSTAKPKGMIDHHVHLKNAVPGAARYRPKKVRKKVGVRFSTAYPKNDVEWKVYRAKQTPGPGNYKLTDVRTTNFTVGHSGKFNKSKPASDVDVMCRKASQEPGPQSYCSHSLKKDRIKGNGRFSSSVLPTFADVQRNYTKGVPGPGSYASDVIERKRKSTTGKFSKNQVPGYIQYEVNLRRENPSPQGYRPSFDKKGGGGRFSTAMPKSDVDWAIHRAKSIPGPSQYVLGPPIHSDVLKNRRRQFDAEKSVKPDCVQVCEPRNPLQGLKCFNGEIDVPQDLYALFRAAGIIQRLKAMVKKNVVLLVKNVIQFPPSPGGLNAQKALQSVLSRVQERFGVAHPRSIVMTKLVAGMLREKGQIKAAIDIMSATVKGAA